MAMITYLLIGILVLVMLAGGIVLIHATKRRGRARRKEKTDYQAFFVMGICFLGAGIAISTSTGNPGLLGITARGSSTWQ